jgi:hypothetical protein
VAEMHLTVQNSRRDSYPKLLIHELCRISFKLQPTKHVYSCVGTQNCMCGEPITVLFCYPRKPTPCCYKFEASLL